MASSKKLHNELADEESALAYGVKEEFARLDAAIESFVALTGTADTFVTAQG